MALPISNLRFAALNQPVVDPAQAVKTRPPQVSTAAAAPPPVAEDKSLNWSSLTPAAKVTTAAALLLATGSIGALAFATIVTAPYLVILATLFLAIAMLALALGKAEPKPAPSVSPASVSRKQGTTTRLLDGGIEAATAPGRALALPRRGRSSEPAMLQRG